VYYKFILSLVDMRSPTHHLHVETYTSRALDYTLMGDPITGDTIGPTNYTLH